MVRPGMRDEFGGYWPGRHEMTVEPRCGWSATPDRVREHLVFTVEPRGEVRRALTAAAAPLRGSTVAAAAPPHYYHVTVSAVGAHVDPGTSRGPHELEPADLDRLRRRAAGAVDRSGVDPFEARLPRINVFPRVVFCEVHADERLGRLSDTLCTLDRVRCRDPGLDFVPHVTLGHFVDTDVGGLLDALAADRTVRAPPLSVDAVELTGMCYDGDYPDRRTVARFPLG